MKSRIRAFTLIETLLVLSISCFLVLLFSFTVKQSLSSVRGELFLAQFEQSYKNTQILAASTHQVHILTVNNQTAEVHFSAFTVKFDEKGNNSSLQKLIFSLPAEHKTVTYQLEMGSGKYKKTTN